MNESIWNEHTPSPPYTQLEQSGEHDIVIVGAGLCGIYTAYLLAKRGLQVLLVEAQSTVGGVATKRSTGKLTAQHGAIYHQLKEQDRYPYYQANEDAIQRALEPLSVNSYEKVTSYLFSTDEDGEQKLRDEYECYKQLPFTPVASSEIELPLNIKLAIGMPDMYQINPATFTNDIVQLALQAGVTIHTNTRIKKVDVQNKTLTAENGVVLTCKHIILCTHYPIESMRNLYSVKLKIIRSYLTATPTFDHLPNHYLSIGKHGRTIRTAIINDKKYFIYGGGNHFAGTIRDTEPYYTSLINEIKDIYTIDAEPIVWSSQDIETADSVPYIGTLVKGDDSVLIATGFKKWGLSTSLLAAEILTAAIVREYHPAQYLFDPHRSLTGTQFVNSIAQASFIMEHFISGHLTRRNAPKCTHLGCKTRWNDADRTWDCPCHGSRFSEDGNVVEGPAVYPLKFE